MYPPDEPHLAARVSYGDPAVLRVAVAFAIGPRVRRLLALAIREA